MNLQCHPSETVAISPPLKARPGSRLWTSNLQNLIRLFLRCYLISDSSGLVVHVLDDILAQAASLLPLEVAEEASFTCCKGLTNDSSRANPALWDTLENADFLGLYQGKVQVNATIALTGNTISALIRYCKRVHEKI